MAIYSHEFALSDGAELSPRIEHLVDLIQWRAKQHPDRPAYIFLADGERDERRLTFGELDARAAALAAHLQQRGLAGQRALLVYDPGLDYIIAFYACLYAGVVAVPVYPPDPMRLARVLPRLMSIVQQADARVVLSTREILEWSGRFFAQAPEIEHVLATENLAQPGEEELWVPPGLQGESLAFLQYTSGSCGDPKGVMLTHSNLLHNLDQMGRVHHERASCVSWLPPYHDMGLIGGILLLAYRGCPLILLSPLSFVQRPMRWLEAISRYRATSSGSPNFGYELCVKKIDPAECAGLDLSSWRLACNGAEPIRADTLERFYEKFAPYGLRRETFCPCYGMAETTLMVSCADLTQAPVIRTFDAVELEIDHVCPIASDSPTARALVSSGKPVDYEEVLIVDPETCLRCSANGVGEIWVSGPNVAQGYWNRPELSQATFGARLADGDGETFLRTGDLGFLFDGELFVTGRLKDLIIVAGRNHYPQDIERTVEQTHAALKQDGGVVFALEVDGEERVVIVHEVVRPRKLDLADLVQKIRNHVVEAHEVPVHAVVLIQSGSLPKTSSGKVQRSGTKQMFLSSDLLVLAQWRADEAAGRTCEAAYEAPRTNTEEVLAGLWSEVLGTRQVGRNDNFFAFGGQSLLATQLMTRVGAVWNVELPLTTLFESPTLADLAQRIDQAQLERAAADSDDSQVAGTPRLVPMGRGDTLPLSFAQQRLWFLDRLEPGNPYYNLPAAAQIDGPLDAAALEQALNEIIRRHEPLRTVFPTEQGQPRQSILPAAELKLEQVDLRRVNASGRECELRRLMMAEARRPFDLVRGPLLRAVLYRTGEESHTLLLSMHHIIADGYSLGLLVRETSILYDAFRRGSQPALAAPAVQYADFAIWQRAYLDADRLEQGLAYWQRRLSGAPQVLELPTDRPRPTQTTFAGALESRVLSLDSSERLQHATQAEGVTLFMFMLAGFDAVLHAYSGQEDLVVGSPIAGRNRKELESLVGFFANTLALRTDLSGNPTFRELLSRVKRTTLEAYAHQDVPFDKLVERLDPARSRQHAPLFQVALVMENAPLPLEDAGSLRIVPTIVDNGTAKYDLTIYCWPRKSGIELVAEYSTELFDRATITRLLAGLEAVLAAAAANAAQPLAELPLVVEADRRQMLVDWNNTRRPLPGDATLPALFAEQVARTPKAVAVVDARGSLTYAELDRRSNQLAHYLQKLGVGPDMLVALCLERSSDMLVALLGVLKGGGAYVPLDPAYPSQRIAHMLDDAQARVLISQQGLLDSLPPHEAEEVLLDVDAESIAREPSTAPTCAAGPDHLAYTIYTSGSTGKPKGVEITHRALANFLLSFRDEPGITADDVLVAVTTLSFDIAGLEMFLPLLVGSRVVIASRETAVDGQALAALLAESGTFMQATPATWRLLIEADWRPRSRFKVLCGGEAMTVPLAKQLLERCDSLWNVYGPTETTIWSTVCEVRCAKALANFKFVPIGRPIANTDVYVLRSSGSLAPIGVPGELYIGGLGVARGYRNRPELTSEKFVAHPFSADPQARLYRTGDRVRWLADGTLEFLGRADHQIKIRGYRVEPGEIEHVLARHPAVREAVVIVREDTLGDARLVGYFTLRDGHSIELAELRGLFEQRLPDYMVPSALVSLAEMPRTPNGKLDRRALPEPGPQQLDTASEFAPPATGTEEALAGIWCEVLGANRVGRHDDFFDLGGHSLLATQVMSRVWSLWELELPLRTIFESPKLCDLAEKIDAVHNCADHPVAPIAALGRIDRDGPLPLSFAQQRLWFLDQMEPGNPFYNLPTAARLVGPLDRSLLQRSLNEVIRRQEGLRTVFVQHAGQPEQRILPAAELPLAEIDLRCLPESERSERLEREMTAEARRPFDLARGPLLRATLFKLANEEHVLLLAMHHVVADGWSLGVLVRELATIYEALRHGRTSPLSELSIQYADFAAWQRKFLARADVERQLAWWQDRLGDVPPPLDLPTDYPRPRMPQFVGGLVTRELSSELRDALHRTSRSEGVTFFMTLLAGFESLLWRYTGQERFCIGTPIANRTRVEIEPLVGFFANTLVLPADLDGSPTFRELLQRVKQTTLDAYAHQDVPFEKLVEALAPARSRQHSPLFQVALVLENAPLPLEQPGGLRIEPRAVDNGTSKYDFTLFCWEHHGRLTLTAEYSTELFQASTIARLLEALESLLAAAIADTTRRVAELPLVSLVEQAKLLVDFNRTMSDFPASQTLVDLFVDAARREPGTVAVKGASESLTYADLDRRSNQLARHLQSVGVGRESLVGLCLERGPATIVGIVGILKSGAAYVPLDPAWPAARLARLLADAEVAAVVSNLVAADRLPELTAPIVLLDRDAAAIAACDVEPLVCSAEPESLAYVIYTSGSTGQPKGVEVRHRALVNHAWHLAERFALEPGDRMLQFISASFDASAEEIFPALASGATLVMYPTDADRAGRELAAFCQAEKIDVWHLPTAVWKQLVDELSSRGEALSHPPRVVLIGGEAISRETLEAWRKLTGGRGRFLHAYGLTEAAITSTLWETTLDHAPALLGDKLPIGRPIANTEVYVLDPAGQPAPLGVPGELYIGGIGLARGYHRRPEMTAARFIANPLSTATPGTAQRVYRTGDRARWLADGNLEFLGRHDEQVKLNGLRIEPGEIETVLREHAGVRDAVVLLREDAPGQKQLVAYVVPQDELERSPEAGQEDAEAEREQVAHWHTIFDATYTHAQGQGDPTFALIGWNSSYTGQPIPAEEMREWLDQTVERVRSLKPEGFDRVLEIGCGTGMVTFRVAPHAREYRATDFSAASLRYVEQTLETMPQRPKVVLHHQPADDFADLPEGTFDLVIVNSVVQYFPSADYLVRVIEGAARLLKPGGAIFLGDLRSYPLLNSFHASVELAHASDDVSRSTLLERVRRRTDQEQELCVDPSLFATLTEQVAELSGFDIRLKRGRHTNELTRFRYDAVLHAGSADAAGELPRRRWHDGVAQFELLRKQLQSSRPEQLALTGVPNSRVAADDRAWELICDEAGPATAGELRQRLERERTLGLDPELFWKLGEELGYEVQIGWTGAGEHGAFDVAFRGRNERLHGSDANTNGHAGKNSRRRPTDWRRYTTDPLKGLFTARLVPGLRERLAAALPAAWMPTAFVVLEQLPLTVGGKVDRRALPAPAPLRPEWSGPYIAPRNDFETRLVEIWEKLLSLRTIGVQDSFFDLGGHSMLAVKLIAEIETAFGRRLPLNVLFQRPTVAQLAELIARPDATDLASSLVPIQPAGRSPAFFCVHPAGGTVFCYRDLAAALGNDQPFFGLQAQGIDGIHAPHSRLEDMAAHYIQAMREAQPAGPYHLGGWSLGGNIAYEMACQLTEAGEEVALLALLDAGALAPDRHASEEDFLAMLAGLFPSDDPLPLEQLREASPQEQMNYFVSRMQEAHLAADEGWAKNAQHVFDVFQANVQAIVDYRPRPYVGRMTLLKAAEQAVNLAGDEFLGWSPYAAGGIDLHVIAGDHVHLVREPNVRQVAACLTDCLQAERTAK